MFHPHFEIHSVGPDAVPPWPAGVPVADEPAVARTSLGPMLVRTAECLVALVQGPTTQAGLNEARYRVLDALRRNSAGTCSQTELAAQLLQSESNLSTLLERMRKDDLISRVRSESDRRVALIGLSESGAAALARADLARSRAMATVLRILDEPREEVLAESLRLLLQTLEQALGLAASPLKRQTAVLTSNGLTS